MGRTKHSEMLKVEKTTTIKKTVQIPARKSQPALGGVKKQRPNAYLKSIKNEKKIEKLEERILKVIKEKVRN